MKQVTESFLNIEIHSDLEKISEEFKGILLDAYGVFWGGNEIGLFPGCRQVMERLVMQGKIIGILSNTTQLAKNEIEKLKAHGLIESKHFHFLITSGEVTKRLFFSSELPFPTPNKKYFLFGTIHPRFSSHSMLFEGSLFQQTTSLLQADFIYISIPHIDGKDQTDPSVFKKDVVDILHSDLPMICSNPDHFAYEGNPPQAVVRQGSIAKIYAELGGKVFYIGKPSERMFSSAMNDFYQYNISNAKDVIMVGDTPETDIRGAKNFGMSSALILNTGITADRITKHGFKDTFNALSNQDLPDYFIELMVQNAF